MSESDTSSVLAAALRYASAGIAVFPTRLGVRGDGKKDVRPIASWKEASTTDPDVIRSWFGQGGGWEGAALCVDCGKSGIVGVDQDVTEGKSGIIEWEMLSPAPTWRVKSPTGGAHDYYRADPSSPVSVDNTGTVAPGVDIRGEGGFLFAPPSIDPRGGSWEWVAGEPDWEALPPVPRVVIERMAGKASAARKTKTPSVPPVAPAALSPSVDEHAFAMGGMAALFSGDVKANMPDFGPGGGRKTRSDAFALMSRERASFVALTEEGNERSHILSQRFGVLAGRGVGVFWEYEWALDALMGACAENGFTAVNGEAYARGQAARGLEHGMREPWIAVAEPAEELEAAVASVESDDVDALLAEMLTIGEVTTRQPPKFLVHGLLQFDSESWIIGEPGSKKSFVAFDIAARAVRGEMWQGRRTNPCDVVMVVAEGAGGTGKRIKAWEARYGAIEKPGHRSIYILPRPVQAASREKWAVLIKACARIADRAREHGRGLLVILDTQARVTVGLQENVADQMGIFIDAVGGIRAATGACVLTIHHTGRANGAARGSNAIDGAQTTELKVHVTEKNKLTGKITVEKQKDIEEIAAIKLAFSPVAVGLDDDGAEVTSLVLLEQGSAEFRAAWSASGAGEGEAWVPFAERKTWEPWVMRRREPRGQAPTGEWWVVQAIVDTAETHGLTQAQVKDIVNEKLSSLAGKRVTMDKTSFGRAFQRATDEAGRWADVIVKADGGRWTVDRLAVESAREAPEEAPER